MLPCTLLPLPPPSPEQVELPPADLGPTASLTQTLSLLREVLASHDSSVVPLDARQADFAQVGLHLVKERCLLLHCSYYSFNKLAAMTRNGFCRRLIVIVN